MAATTPSNAPSMSTPATGRAGSAKKLDLSATPTPRLKRRSKHSASAASPVQGTLRGKRRLDSPEAVISGLAGVAAPVLLPSPAANAGAGDTPSKWRVTPSSKKIRPETADE